MNEHRHTVGITRREILQVGYSGLLGLGLNGMTGAAGAAGVGRPRREKSLILVFLTGGPSHVDTFDLKPGAPAEIRGPFQPIPTATSGIQICEHLPGFAKRMERLAVIRSVTHRNNGHLPATHWLLTGRAIPGIPEDLGVDKIRSRSDWPSYASGLDHFRPRTDGIPNGVHLPTYLQEGPLLWPGQYAGCLGPKHDPWQIAADPNRSDFRVDNLSLPAGFAVDRLDARRRLLDSVNQSRDRLGRLAETESLSDQQQAAFSLLTAQGFSSAFQLDREPTAVRDRYGRHLFGQSLLLARRLVESGVRVVQANMGIVQTWDTHADNWNRLKDGLLPPLDQGVGALLDDLAERGMTDDVMVLVTGEFGRSPRITTLAGQSSTGRDHWAEVFSSVFSGGGVRGGQVIGASDPTGASPATSPVTPDDIGATVYQHLGLPAGTEFIDREGRPQKLNLGRPIEALFSGA